MAQEVLYSVADGVATITLNRPERLNALNGRDVPRPHRGIRPDRRATTRSGPSSSPGPAVLSAPALT